MEEVSQLPFEAGRAELQAGDWLKKCETLLLDDFHVNESLPFGLWTQANQNMQREYVSCSSLDFFPPKRLFSIQKKIDILYNNRQLLWRARIFIISIYQVV